MISVHKRKMTILTLLYTILPYILCTLYFTIYIIIYEIHKLYLGEVCKAEIISKIKF